VQWLAVSLFGLSADTKEGTGKKKAMERLLRWTLATIMHWPLIFWGCVAINLIGAVLGAIFWYGAMLLNAPLWAIPFIPDCPLAALLGSITLIGFRWRRNWSWFTAFTAFACIKYGLWTMLFWLRQWIGSGEITFIGLVLFVSHIGLFIEGLLFVPHIGEPSLLKRLGIIGWFLLSIYVDYGLGYDPGMASDVPLVFAFRVALILTLVIGTGLLLMPYTEKSLASQPAVGKGC
jgi:uncharacterized membrane protein YpjA